MAPPPPPPGGFAPPPGGYAMAGGGMMATGNLASPGLRIVQGLIDVVIVLIVNGIIAGIFSAIRIQGVGGLVALAVDIVGLAYLWSNMGQSIGMMPFGFKVRDQATGQAPSMGKAALRAFIWLLGVGFTFCLIGALDWLWMLWDPNKQTLHDKIAGTIVTQG